MKYARGPDLRWTDLAPQAVIRVRPHHVVDLAHSSLILARDAPGWVVVPSSQSPVLSTIDGRTVGNVLSQTDMHKESIDSLYRAGLLSINDEVGLTGERECHSLSCQSESTAEPARAEMQAPQPQNICPDTILLKLTGACNWACSYCYDYDKSRFDKHLALKDVREAIEYIIMQHHRITLMFHGGEPLLRSSELHRIVQYTKERCQAAGATARFSLQTNGALVDEETINFLNENSFDVGMSIDGQPQVNDRTRVDHLGRGTAHVLERLFERFPEFMTGRVGYITTVTSQNVDELYETARYLRELGVQSWKTAIFDTEGRGADAPNLSPSVETYVNFLLRWIRECEAGAWSGFRFKNILELIDVIGSPKRRNMCLKFPCGAGRELVVASADKRLLACDATYHEAFDLGTNSNDISSGRSSQAGSSLFEREEWLLTEAECARCPWLHYCAGTCMAKALIKHGTVKAVDDFECTVRKAIMPLLFDSLAKSESGLREYYKSSRQLNPRKSQDAYQG